MNIKNYTPHNVAIFKTDDISYNPSIRKWIVNDGATPMFNIPSSGMLNANIDTVQSVDISGVPSFVKRVTGCDPLPAGDFIVLVSALYATAAQKSGLINMSRVFTIADPVFTPDGRTVVGCRGICPAF